MKETNRKITVERGIDLNLLEVKIYMTFSNITVFSIDCTF